MIPGIISFAASYSNVYFFVGATRSSCTAQWAWVDATPTSNLNCGGSGCGLWGVGAPDCYLSQELFAGSKGAAGEPMALNDFMEVSSGYITAFPCEWPNPVQAGWFYAAGSSTKVLLRVALASLAAITIMIHQSTLVP